MQTDQKSLESILARSLNEATPRLQRLLIKASAYNFSVEYIPGQTNQVADCLSQLGCIKDNIVLPKLRVNAITQQLSNPDDIIQDIRLETVKDDELSLLKHIVTTGWPEWIREVPKEVQPYWMFREELTVEKGLLLKSTWIIIPKVMRDRFLNELQTGHLGVTKCIKLAKQTMYWPGINSDIEQFIASCQPCLKYAASNKKCPEKKNQLGQEIPVTPWTKLGTDIFTLGGVNYLLIVDYTSKFPVIWKLTSMTGKAVASHFKNIMSEYTWPCTIVSDNGPCYVSKEFHELMQQKGVNHILVSPQHPQPNGMAEKYVGIVKQLFLKAREEGKDPADALHTYRPTPLDSKTPSPMAILIGRLPCTNLPMSCCKSKDRTFATAWSSQSKVQSEWCKTLWVISESACYVSRC